MSGGGVCVLCCGLEACVIVSCFVFCGDVDLDQEVGRWTQVRAIGRRKEKHTNFSVCESRR